MDKDYLQWWYDMIRYDTVDGAWRSEGNTIWKMGESMIGKGDFWIEFMIKEEIKELNNLKDCLLVYSNIIQNVFQKEKKKKRKWDMKVWVFALW